MYRLSFLLMLMLLGCNTVEPPAPKPTFPQVLGLLEVTLDLRNISGQAKFTSLFDSITDLGTQDVKAYAEDIYLSSPILRVIEDVPDNIRYIHATFDLSPKQRSYQNLSLIATSFSSGKHKTQQGTMFRSLLDMDGVFISNKAKLGEEPIYQVIKPAHGMQATTKGVSVDTNLADFQAFLPEETRKVKNDVSELYPEAQVLEFGFVAHNKLGDRIVPSTTCTPNDFSYKSDCHTGEITLTLKFPIAKEPEETPAVFTMVFLVVDQTERRVTRSPEETTESTAARATVIKATEVILLGNDTDDISILKTIRLTDIHTSTAPTFLLGLGVCGGFARLNVVTPPGFCIGILAKDLSKPRGILPLQDGRLLLTEFYQGDFDKHGGGALSVLTPSYPTYTLQRLHTDLDIPQGLAVGPDQKIYVGEDSAIFRFPLDNLSLKDYVITDLPLADVNSNENYHPLSSLVFDAQGNLYVNTGAPSDNCESQAGSSHCSETDVEASVRQYTFDWVTGQTKTWQVFSKGLRNSNALVVHDSGTFLQGENSRDLIQEADPTIDDEEHPMDEINVLKQGFSYGWPYCYENVVTSPEFSDYDCSIEQNAAVLLPAHSAPLGMAYWKADTAFQNMLIVVLGGYRKYGHRLVAFPIDDKGVPNGSMIELIKGWDNPLGGPVDVKEGPDGWLYLTDKRNNQVLVFRQEF